MKNSRSITNDTVTPMLLFSSMDPSITQMPKLAHEQKNQQKLLVTSRNFSPGESAPLRKGNSMRKSLIDGKENLYPSQFSDKLKTDSNSLAMLSERVAKLEEKELQQRLLNSIQKLPSDSSVSMSQNVMKLIEGASASVAIKHSDQIEKRILTLSQEINALKDRFSSAESKTQTQTLKLCKKIIDDKIVGQKIERIKALREESERLHDKFNFQYKMWSQKLEHEHRFVEHSMLSLRSLFKENSKSNKEYLWQSPKQAQKSIQLENMFLEIEEIKKKMTEFSEKIIASKNQSFSSFNKTHLLAEVHLKVALHSLIGKQTENTITSIPLGPNSEYNCSYAIDSDGYVCDCNGFYLKDRNDSAIRLSPDQIARLKEYMKHTQKQ